jgi:tetratricopeptide (TPR) repeat protein
MLWLPRLKYEEEGNRDNTIVWAEKRFPRFDKNDPAICYSDVFKALFASHEEGQREIERLVEGRDPGFGYAVLSQLLAHKDFGMHFNVVLTTNFDDLVADAFHLFSNQKPLVIYHESLIRFVKISGTRPTVIKLHGDAKFEPKNKESDTRKLDKKVEEVLRTFFAETGLIFIGYGGNDKSIAKVFNNLPPNAFPRGIYWVGNHLPNTVLGKHLKNHDVTLVKHRDFDELMLYIRNEFDFKHPDEKRFTKIIESYKETFKTLYEKIGRKEDSPEKEILEKAADKAASEFEDWWSVYLEASKHEKSDPDKADQIYKDGLIKFPTSSELNGIYAIFLTDDRKNHDEAERLYNRLLELEPDNAIALGSYASFLHTIRKDYDEAERLYKRAIELEPDDANNLGNYANFLTDVRKNHDEAERLYNRLLELEPDNPITYANYGQLLLFLGREDEGFALIAKALLLPHEEHLDLSCNFYLYVHSKDEAQRKSSLNRIMQCIGSGVRSYHWDSSITIERAERDRHPQIEFLKVLAKVIADEADAKELDQFEVWTKADV